MSNVQNRLKLGLRKKELLRNSRSLKVEELPDKFDLENIENAYRQSENLFDKIEMPKQVSKSHPIISQTLSEQNHNLTQQIYQSNGALEQFQIKYDELRKQYEHKRSQNQQLLRNNKMLEIEVLNCNKEYYEKQINRLRTALQKCQQDAEEYKHRLFLAENANKELSASNNCKTEQVKNYIKLIEKEKISTIQTKHQLAEKDKMYGKIVQEMEQSNFVLSTNFEEMSQKYTRADSLLKQKIIEFESLNSQLQSSLKRTKEWEDKFALMKKQYDRLLNQKSERMSQLQESMKKKDRESNQIIEKLSIDLQTAKNTRVSQSFIIQKKAQEIKSGNEYIELELRVVRLEETNKQLQIENKETKKIVEALERKLMTCFSAEQYHDLEIKILNAQDRRMASQRSYEEKLLSLKQQNEKLCLSNLNTNNLITQNSTANNTYNFNEILRSQIQQNRVLKKQIEKRIDENQKLREQIVDLKLSHKSYENQIQILEKKVKASEKNTKIEQEVEMQVLQNQIDSLKRKLSTSQTRLEIKIRQNKQKDSFIQSTIIGRSKGDDVPLIIAEFQRILLNVQKNSLNPTHK